MNKKTELRECIALSLIKLLGSRRIYKLLEVVDHPQEVFRLTESQLKKIDKIGEVTARQILTFNRWQEVDRIIERTEKIGAWLLTLNSPEYPEPLKQIYDPPLLLWGLGNLNILNDPCLAVVGTRRPTKYGLNQARKFTRDLLRADVTIVSGLAHGIDSAAHRTCLKYEGKTAAVLGSGIDVIYPAANKGLARAIIRSNGAIISEYLPGTKPEGGNFPVRNRIVSGLSLGVFVAESAREGGSMITASSALDQNREVFTIPHSLENDSGVGCNALLKRGHAKLVQEARDFWDELPVEPPSEETPATEVRDAEEEKRNLNRTARDLFTLLKKGPMHIDQLADKLELTSAGAMAELFSLEMQGWIRQRPGKIFELAVS